VVLDLACNPVGDRLANDAIELRSRDVPLPLPLQLLTIDAGNDCNARRIKLYRGLG
jgi:hypothetical protein